MPDIDPNKIRQIDGSLLLVLRELLRHKRTTTAAQRLGLSQSAVSHSLSRLRELFGDQLFIRRPYGLEPTRHALELAPRIDALLLQMQDALGLGSGFTPGTSERGFRIGAPDHLTTLLAPPLLRQFSNEAPNARFAFSQRLGNDALDGLRRDEIDLAVGRFARRRIEGLVVEPLFEDRLCVIAREDHPKLKRKLTSALYAELEHIQISIGGDFRSLQIEPVGERPSPRKMVAAVPRFLIAFAVVGQSDAIALAPSLVAERYASAFGFKLHPLPFELEPVRMLAVRKPQPDLGVDWLLSRIKACIPVERALKIA